MFTIGQTIPDLELDVFQNNEFSKIKLSNYKNKWLILLFYPADFSYVCPTELAEAAEYYPKFQAANAEIISISTDSMYVHKAWHDVSPLIKRISYPMAADPTGNTCRMFGIYNETEGQSFRATFIIDPDMVLKAADIHDDSIGRNSAEILRKVQAAGYVREHSGMVCPAGWHPGDEAMKKGIELVGKI
jgi:peroxiredoxin (alkyl hydroperoxide reductase subunit C)